MRDRLFFQTHQGPLLLIDLDQRSSREGANGIVYSVIGDPTHCVKIYKNPADGSFRQNRLLAMLARPPDLPAIDHGGISYHQLAWPNAIIRDGIGKVRGFRMPRIDVNAAIPMISALVPRERKNLGINEPIAVAAFNLATVVWSIHKAGHRLVDMKPENLFVYRRFLYVALVDCDDFHVVGPNGAYPALAFTPGFICPEGKGKSPAELGTSEDQDRFALAVLLFRLMNENWHPFSGRPLNQKVPAEEQERIDMMLYPYASRPHPQIAPAPGCPYLKLSSETRLLFERAFTSRKRPSAAEWVEHLSDIARHARAQRPHVQVHTPAATPANAPAPAAIAGSLGPAFTAVPQATKISSEPWTAFFKSSSIGGVGCLAASLTMWFLAAAFCSQPITDPRGCADLYWTGGKIEFSMGVFVIIFFVTPALVGLALGSILGGLIEGLLGGLAGFLFGIVFANLFAAVASSFVGASYYLNTPLNVVVVATLIGSAIGGVVFWVLRKEMSKPMLSALLLQMLFAVAIAWYGYTSGHASARNAGLGGIAAMPAS